MTFDENEFVRGQQEKWNEQIASGANNNGQVLLDRKDPLLTARLFAMSQYRLLDMRTLVHHRDDFYAWKDSHYIVVSNDEIRAKVYDFLETSMMRGKQGPEPFKPTARAVSDVIDALKAVANLEDRILAPSWLDDGHPDCDPADLIVCRNGLLDMRTRQVYEPTPLFYGHTALGFDFDRNAAEPAEWLAFLNSIWTDDPEAIAALQEIFGYCLTTDISQQKIFMLVGPKRSGKGTIARILKALLGSINVAGPTLSGLGTNFGLSPLIGKQLAVISDARLSGRSDLHLIAERLLSISGEDHVTVDRKFKSAWTGTLPTKFMILTNELPRISDASGALASRFILLCLTKSFYGGEDLALTKRLMTELPGILNWALDGLDKLQDRGHFVQPQSSQDAVQELDDLGSPINAFVRDRCTIGPEKEIECQLLYDAWKTWCELQGRKDAGTVQTFSRDLRAAVPGLHAKQHRSMGMKRAFHGIGI
jgi:putative DNA primase/helicase